MMQGYARLGRMATRRGGAPARQCDPGIVIYPTYRTHGRPMPTEKSPRGGYSGREQTHGFTAGRKPAECWALSGAGGGADIRGGDCYFGVSNTAFLCHGPTSQALRFGSKYRSTFTCITTRSAYTPRMDEHHRKCKCGAIYRRTESMAPGREVSSYECSVCGETIENWNSTWVPSYRLVAGPVVDVVSGS